MNIPEAACTESCSVKCYISETSKDNLSVTSLPRNPSNCLMSMHYEI